MGLKCTNYFENSKYDSPNIQIITCKGCCSHLCLSDLILSDNFNGASGPAYLVKSLINIEYNLNSEETPMKTGVYKINKIKCHQCKLPLGWYYKKSYNYSESYKEGKFVIEKNFINFIDNLTTTQLMIEKVLQNKYKRRYSSTSSTTTSSDNSILSDLDHPHSHSNLTMDSSIEKFSNNDDVDDILLAKEKFKFINRKSYSASSSSSSGSNSSNLLNRLRLPSYSNGTSRGDTNNGTTNSTANGNNNADDDDVFVDA
ncbi:Yippee-like zinc-binding protein, putative [Candida maltosa Xu316]|uniref:Yippee-like zinc-binding protein, putative n=1 Tax=Candida maltosa (strain Xu316) TaxID=1245528 RepID=M3K0L8_CANMX|nr:Yippee-like zinc-binding protein, putative [Candida maltosa Xu316]